MVKTRGKSKNGRSNRTSGSSSHLGISSNSHLTADGLPSSLSSPHGNEENDPISSFRELVSSPNDAQAQPVAAELSIDAKFEMLNSAIESTRSQMLDMFNRIMSAHNPNVLTQTSATNEQPCGPGSILGSHHTTAGPFHSVTSSRFQSAPPPSVDVNFHHRQTDAVSTTSETSRRATANAEIRRSRAQQTRDYVNQYGPDIQAPCDFAPQQPLAINQIAPPRFDGDRTRARTWLKQYTDTMSINGYNETQMMVRVSAYLEGEAYDWLVFERYLNRELDWYSFRSRFNRYFLGGDSTAQLAKKIDSCRQKSDELAISYLTRATQLCLEFNPNMRESDIINKIAPGFREEIYNALIMLKKKDDWTLEWISDKVQDLRFSSKREPRENNSSKSTENPRAPRSKVKVANLADWTCFNCSNKGHLIENCDQPKNEAMIEANKKAYTAQKTEREAASGKAPREINKL